MALKPPPGDAPLMIGNRVSTEWLLWFQDLHSTFAGLDSGSLLVETDSNSDLTDVDDLTDWIAGTANEITVTDDGDGTITLSGAGSDTNITVVTAIQAGGVGAVGFQYKTRALTLNGGVITTVGAESGWNDV